MKDFWALVDLMDLQGLQDFEYLECVCACGLCFAFDPCPCACFGLCVCARVVSVLGLGAVGLRLVWVCGLVQCACGLLVCV